MDTTLNIIVYFLITILVISSVPKIINLVHFMKLVEEYDFLPKTLLKMYAVLLPFLELVCVIMFMSNLVIYSSVLLLILLMSFLVGVVYILKTGKAITCGCYGKFLDTRVSGFTIVKISILILSTLIIITIEPMFVLIPDIPSVLSGITLAFILLCSEIFWSKYKNAIEILG